MKSCLLPITGRRDGFIGDMEQTSVLPIVVNGMTRYVSGVTQKTTCQDILEKVKSFCGVDKNQTFSLALFDSSHGVERMLPGKTKVLKVCSRWLTESGKYALVLRKAGSGPQISYAKRKVLHQKPNDRRLKPYEIAASNPRNVLNSLAKSNGDNGSKRLAVPWDQEEYAKALYFDDYYPAQSVKPERCITRRLRSRRKNSIAPCLSTGADGQVKCVKRTRLSGCCSHKGERFYNQNLAQTNACSGTTNDTYKSYYDNPLYQAVHFVDIEKEKQTSLHRSFDKYEIHMPTKRYSCRRRLEFRSPLGGSSDSQFSEKLAGEVEAVLPSLKPTAPPCRIAHRRPLVQSQSNILTNTVAESSNRDECDRISLVNSRIEFQGSKFAIIKKQRRLTDCVYFHPSAEYNRGLVEDELCYSSDDEKYGCNNKIPISSFSFIHEHIERLVSNYLPSDLEDEGSSSADSDYMSM